MHFQNFEKFIQEFYPIIKASVSKYYRQPLNIITKQDLSPVTACDIEIERLFKESILKQYPDHAVLGEESGITEGNSEFSWVIDPIDGTKSFISGVPLFTTLIAFLHNKKPIYGTIINPILDDIVVGNNEMCKHNNKQIRLRPCAGIKDATLLTSDHRNVAKYQKKEPFEQLMNEVKIYRTWGDGYGYFLTATGFADIMVDPIVSPWDALPIIPIMRGAGAVITDFQGNDPVVGTSLVACVPELHQHVISMLN